MKPIPMIIWHDPPRHAAEDQVLPREQARGSLDELCCLAKITCRVSGGIQSEKRIVICDGSICFRVVGTAYDLAYVAVPKWRGSPLQALRVLETLAYAFHDYEARECVSFRGLFVTTRPMGRPAKSGRARTAAERMREMRARRATAGSAKGSA